MIDRLLLWALHRLEPERAHNLTVRLTQATGALPPLRWLAGRLWGVPRQDPVTVMGLRFPNRIGIAAGYDKDAIALSGLAALGIGHVEVGTVTPRPQPGNDRPRVFRLDVDQSVINKMGFPSRGADYVSRRLRGDLEPIVGVNIGKNRDTPLDDAVSDYVELAARFASVADYICVNVSSPNTPGLRQLQRGDDLRDLLTAVSAAAAAVPVVAKLSPDLDDEGLDAALSAISSSGAAGVVASNTTVRRDGLTTSLQSEAGGLSGAALSKAATAMVAKISERTGGALPIIAAGGVMSSDDAVAKLDAGADLVQVYTGLIYRGPRLLAELVAATQ